MYIWITLSCTKLRRDLDELMVPVGVPNNLIRRGFGIITRDGGWVAAEVERSSKLVRIDKKSGLEHSKLHTTAPNSLPGPVLSEQCRNLSAVLFRAN